jgi:hypothetical protein
MNIPGYGRHAGALRTPPLYVPRSHPDHIDVNVRCRDGDVSARFTVTPFDGANWEANVATIQKARGGRED